MIESLIFFIACIIGGSSQSFLLLLFGNLKGKSSCYNNYQSFISDRIKNKKGCLLFVYSLAGNRNTSSIGSDKLFPSIDINSTFIM